MAHRVLLTREVWANHSDRLWIYRSIDLPFVPKRGMEITFSDAAQDFVEIEEVRWDHAAGRFEAKCELKKTYYPDIACSMPPGPSAKQMADEELQRGWGLAKP